MVMHPSILTRDLEVWMHSSWQHFFLKFLGICEKHAEQVVPERNDGKFGFKIAILMLTPMPDCLCCNPAKGPAYTTRTNCNPVLFCFYGETNATAFDMNIQTCKIFMIEDLISHGIYEI